ncbi:hypothetical protein D3C76_716120 [compost metagenome]|uniref:Uncharacterized conserved protein n=1 Tax=Pseudomonas jinjuensis TaxID=198616 RepID=A0A1H0MPP1_9PSED|nr:DUF411 domain-containing protein [Pseudomonas jinjuensis]SDO82337.1 Uncharacterized conserved protein [Pseudomonas jinjuensis]
MRTFVLLTALFAGAVQAAEPLSIDVHRDANCGCCKDWIKHLEDNGFSVRDHVEPNMSEVKTRLGVPYSMGSCHTGVIDGKFVEGHVPAADILKLRERSDLVGAAVPGMPVGSPGMEMGSRHDAYQVVGLGKGGERVVLADYPAH